MKKNLPVTQNERVLAEGTELVSATDTKGRITHANPAFVEISGFAEDELVGSNHNIVRHPDMPPAAFQNLWDTLKRGRPWMGVVKNRCKSGDHYWVDAFVTPSLDGDDIVGYESVRVAPQRATVARAEALYKTLSGGNRPRFRLPTLSLAQRLSAGFALTSGLAIFGAAATMSLPLAGATLAWLGSSVSGAAVVYGLLRGLRDAAQAAREVSDNPAMQYVYTGRRDEVGNLTFAIQTLRAQLRTVLGRIRESACKVTRESADLNRIVAEMAGNMDLQRREVDMVATAMEEMSSSIRDVAQNAANASSSTEQTRDRASAGQVAVDCAIANTRRMADGISRATQTIASLQDDSEAIGAVLGVIRDIADQTNLLALNAAIEAARAGDQGRGFAVVADEVRKLASRTQDSTAEIQAMIERLQTSAGNAVQAMGSSCDQVEESVRSAQQVSEHLQQICVQVASLDDMGRSIATAAEQQSSVSQEISRNIHRIGETAAALADGSRSTREVGEHVSRQAADLESLIRRFRA